MSEEDKNVQLENEKQEETTLNEEKVEETTQKETKAEMTEEKVEDAEDSPEENKEEVEAPKEEEKKEEKKEPVKRTVHTMSVAKAQKEKKKALEKQEAALRAEFEEKTKEKKSDDAVKPSEATEEDISSFAEEQGLDPEAVKKIIDFAQKPISEKLSEVDSLLEDKKRDAENQKVSQEFDSMVSELIKKDYPAATPEHLSKVKEELTKLAFTEEYHTYKLEDIYKVNKDLFEFKNNAPIEQSSGTPVEITDFKSMTAEEEHKLSEEDPEKYEKLIKWQEANQSLYREM